MYQANNHKVLHGIDGPRYDQIFHGVNAEARLLGFPELSNRMAELLVSPGAIHIRYTYHWKMMSVVTATVYVITTVVMTAKMIFSSAIGNIRR